MWPKAEWMGRPMRLELTRVGLLVSLANRYTTRGALSLFFIRLLQTKWCNIFKGSLPFSTPISLWVLFFFITNRMM